MNKINIDSWFSVKCIFGWYSKKTKKIECYEERIILVKAKDAQNAFETAEKEAESYCSKAEDYVFKFEGFMDAFSLSEENLTHLSELYSITRESSLDADEYIDRYYDDGTQNSGS